MSLLARMVTLRPRQRREAKTTSAKSEKKPPPPKKKSKPGSSSSGSNSRGSITGSKNKRAKTDKRGTAAETTATNQQQLQQQQQKQHRPNISVASLIQISESTERDYSNEEPLLIDFLNTHLSGDDNLVQKRDDLVWLYNFVRSRAPKLEPELQGKSTLAFGGFNYKTKSGCNGRWAHVGIMLNKTGFSFMVSGIDKSDGKYILEHFDKKNIAKGKGVSVGKSCIRFRTLADLDLDVLEKILYAAAAADVNPIAV